MVKGQATRQQINQQVYLSQIAILFGQMLQPHAHLFSNLALFLK